MISLIALPNQNKVDPRRAKKESSILYGYWNVELMHEYFLQHLGMGTARMKECKETKEGKQKLVKMKENKVGTK